MLLVFSTFGKKKEAEKAAEALVKGKLAACVSMLPVKSVYNWKGKMERSSEILLIVKCPERNYEKAEALLKKMNSNEVPEIVAMAVSRGLPAYVNWVEQLF